MVNQKKKSNVDFIINIVRLYNNYIHLTISKKSLANIFVKYNNITQ